MTNQQQRADSWAVRSVADDAARVLLQRVYGWMAAGLGLTAVTAYVVAATPALSSLFLGPMFWVCIGVELVMVFTFSAALRRLSVPMALLLFFAYAVVNGLTLSVIFLVYTGGSIAGTFLAAAGTFGGMSAFGMLTRMDLSRFGAYLIMALWGLVVASVVNLFFASGPLYWGITYLGIFVFLGLTAYDTQKIKALALDSSLTQTERQKGALHGALLLYLDFINLFLLLLRLFGRRR